MAKTIVVTDLDGTLLDAGDYSFAEALSALSLLKERGIPVILSSSKTRAEIELYRRRLHNPDPFISENGGGVFIPRDYFTFRTHGQPSWAYNVITLGRPYAEIRAVFIELRQSLGIRVKGFGDMTAREVARISGMTLEEAELAKKREFDEPFVFEGTGGGEITAFLGAVKTKGLHWTRGRFYHMLGGSDKGKAFNILKGMYEKVSDPLFSIGLGDSLNDLPLLKAVDMPVLIPKADGGFEDGIDLKGLVRAAHPGPAGWRDVIMEFLMKNP